MKVYLHFSKSVLLGFLFSVLFTVIFSFNPAEAQITIIGQNNPGVDIQAIQKAVDQGGTVTLKGTFNFGNEGRVNITKDVKIAGETDNKGNPMTKIKGGFWTFHSPLPAKLPPEVPGPKITIQGIHFDGALWTPICLAYSSGATITKNKMTNIRPKAWDEPIMGKSGLNMQQGLLCSPRLAQPKESRKYIPNVFTGNLIIEENDIDLTNAVPTKTIAQGIWVNWTTGVNAQIQRNTVINCSRNSIETIDNFLGTDGSGLIIVKDNKIVTSTEGILVPTPQTPNGIVVGWFLDMSGGLDPQRNIKYIVSNNAIRTRGKTSIGIAVFSDGAIVVNNSISSEGTESVPLRVQSSDGYIAYNKVEGAGSRPGMWVMPWKPFKGSKNVFVDNDLKQFKTSGADAVFDKGSYNNLFIGPSCKVNDLGSNNLIQMTK
jgi:hypothetical protein